MTFDEKEVRRLAELARIELTDAEAALLVRDFRGILGYFEELTKIDTAGIQPLSGGTTARNIHRHDDDPSDSGASRERLVAAFPEREGDYLKVPPVFGD